MREIKKFFREANQMIIGGRLYYSVHEDDFKLLKYYAQKNPAINQAIQEATPLEGHPAPLFLVPADLIKAAEGDMIG
jgi:hypothetical protein